MRSTALLLVLLLVPAGAFAQDSKTSAQGVAHSFAELSRQQVLSEGDSVRVTCLYEQGGEYKEFKAEFVSLTETAIIVVVGELPSSNTDLRVTPPSENSGKYEIEIPGNRTQRIETRRSIRYWGTLIGGAAGALLSIQAAAVMANEGCSECGVGIAAALAGGGAGIGYLIDRSRRDWEPVFLAHPDSSGSLSFSLSPLLSKEQKGILFSLRW